MFGLGFPELILIFIVALLIFGPKKLPDLGRSVGRALSEFKKASDDFQSTMREEMQDVKKNAGLDEIKKLEEEIRRGEEAKKPAPPASEEAASQADKGTEQKGTGHGNG